MNARTTIPAVVLMTFLGLAAGNAADNAPMASCRILADARAEQPLRVIVAEFDRRMGHKSELRFAPADQINAQATAGKLDADLVVCMEDKPDAGTPVGKLKDAKKVAWKYPTSEAVWAAPLTGHPDAAAIQSFLCGPTGHRLWSESPAGFTIIAGTSADHYQWVVENRVKHTYAMSAARMLAECGTLREGLCIDIGCGTGNLDVELAKRSKFRIIGLDIDPDMKPLFEKSIQEANLQDRVSFVQGDAQQLPFPDNHADLIVSRGVLIFLPDIAKCLREVQRVLKPTGVAFLGGRYLYAPQPHKIPTEKLREIVRESGVQGAQVIDDRGQWVKIVGPQAPDEVKQFQGNPAMLAGRLLADYYITTGDCLLIHGGDGGLEQALQNGLVEFTELKITAMYPKEEVAAQARQRIREAGHADRIRCAVGNIQDLPFDDQSFDVVAGVGPVLIWGDRPKAMREIYRVLRDGGVGYVGGRYLYMPESRRVSSEALRESAAQTGISSIRIIDDMGQWVEIRRGIKDRGLAD